MMQSGLPEDNLLRQSYADAEVRERAQWERVKGRYPGQAGHDPQLWAQWLDAAKGLKEAAALLREATRLQQGDHRFGR
jgi:hypothetical protein